jgi:hypothetical protein
MLCLPAETHPAPPSTDHQFVEDRLELYTTFVVKLASIFDKSNDSISLKTLKSNIEKNGGDFSSAKCNYKKIWEKGRRLYKRERGVKP